MGTATTSLSEVARSIFADLGYTVSGSGRELRAERKWRVVHVTATAEPCDAPEGGALRCFVTWKDGARDLREHLLDAKPDYDWAVIAVEDGEEYEVVHPDVGPSPIA